VDFFYQDEICLIAGKTFLRFSAAVFFIAVKARIEQHQVQLSALH